MQLETVQYNPGQPTSELDVTDLLSRWTDGDVDAFDQVVPLIYTRLRAIAHRLFTTERENHTLQATELLHEVYIELNRSSELEFSNRSQFYGLAACLMRRALVDYSRQRCTAKRGGSEQRVSIVEALSVATPRPEAFVALDDALKSLERVDSQKARIVELRYFAGLTVGEAAECLGVSPRTVAREWEAARALLYGLLAQ